MTITQRAIRLAALVGSPGLVDGWLVRHSKPCATIYHTGSCRTTAVVDDNCVNISLNGLTDEQAETILCVVRNFQS